MKLIDTSIFVDHLRRYAPATQFLETLASAEDILFSAITETELITGKDCADEKKRELILHLLHRWNKIPVSNPIAVLAGDISREFRLEVPDAIIAASALLNNAELQTKNVKDFQKVKALKVRAPY